MKGLPLAYSKDMQEDKELVFDAAETLELSLAAMMGMISNLVVNAVAMKRATELGYSTATDFADWLVRALGLPFREAHHITGQAVALAENKKCDLGQLSLSELQSIHPEITDDVFQYLTVEKSVESRTSYGGTAPKEVCRQILYWKKRLFTV